MQSLQHCLSSHMSLTLTHLLSYPSALYSPPSRTLHVRARSLRMSSEKAQMDFARTVSVTWNEQLEMESRLTSQSSVDSLESDASHAPAQLHCAWTGRDAPHEIAASSHAKGWRGANARTGGGEGGREERRGGSSRKETCLQGKQTCAQEKMNVDVYRSILENSAMSPDASIDEGESVAMRCVREFAARKLLALSQ